MNILRITRKKHRNINICKGCDKLMTRQNGMVSYFKGVKCKFDVGYEYACSYCPRIEEDKYVRYEMNERCPYKLEHLLLKEESYNGIKNTEKEM